ncbi:hypothetical protein K503DRAFT_852898 [Rhizopogon vinicolor AM-OR11-026]|uniref:Aminoglycoside phosphotransferase domain-containing protein n=1 Tax=Rhizopogon vinicolor AM-OR11-026 TaxID=1314800 RepID=A0A1B7NGQ8_9AGAM|nr:hypothetical protein K503DRAFT_852898 [Rhizopogon vinicolor AM-OR11-026]
MSTFFPHVNINALKRFAVATAAAEHPPRATGRRPPKKLSPVVASVEDVKWAGEKMIQITFERASLPLGPYTMMAYFPRGRETLTTQAVIGMMTTIRGSSSKIEVPKIYGYKDLLPNDIGAEVVLMEKIPGENLQDVWSTLSPDEELKVCGKLADLLLKLFNTRGSLICTDLLGTGINTCVSSVVLQEGQKRQRAIGVRPLLLSRPFNERPLDTMTPQGALPTNNDYLTALCWRVEHLFMNAEKISPEALDTGFAENPLLTTEDLKQTRETFRRMTSLVTNHIGGFYVPGTLSPAARKEAYLIMQSKKFGIRHGDMQMYRFLVRFLPDKDGNLRSPDSDVELVLCTGWEHSFRAPLWSCARMPLWLISRPILNEPIPWSRQAELRSAIYDMMNQPSRIESAREWIISHVYGRTERWFEGCASAHWMYGRNIEANLVDLKKYWEFWRPDMEFPLEVGVQYTLQWQAPSASAESADEPVAVPTIEELTIPLLTASPLGI